MAAIVSGTSRLPFEPANRLLLDRSKRCAIVYTNAIPRHPKMPNTFHDLSRRLGIVAGPDPAIPDGAFAYKIGRSIQQTSGPRPAGCGKHNLSNWRLHLRSKFTFSRYSETGNAQKIRTRRLLPPHGTTG